MKGRTESRRVAKLDFSLRSYVIWNDFFPGEKKRNFNRQRVIINSSTSDMRGLVFLRGSHMVVYFNGGL